ncbi:MAG: lipase [Bacteroidota bacterium]
MKAPRFIRRLVELAPSPQPPLIRLRHPLLLMHGFGAMANLVQCGVLHEEAIYLRARGVLAYAPHVNPYDTVQTRAEAWADRLEGILQETGATKVNLIGFSSAGLDARFLAETLGYATHIASVITVACPHRGSPLAAWVLDQPAWLRRPTIAVMNGMGASAYEAIPPQAEAGLRELTPKAVTRRFDPARPLPDSIYSASVSSRAGKGAPVAIQYVPLMVTNQLLHHLAGVNDGIVPTSSMAWGEHLATVDADHATLVGMKLVPGGYDSKRFYASLASHLAARGL